eukprot:CAMPEP_0175040296 /NCGR_PEP_ID=MMETSP0052_2-20121109/1173_1 /TAXON_ID=51329 ORGANISM="Polytomella parva, Strain SAG 63-3" /NCGR_SAMPLE_ID=MMETSP0052_2 /ASSEMBLY_ACC=CAM_ASM_000194 /LENGTH=280 /DNA_ID=CAMNT_0016302469 /DNA_START=52 /DNA_END=891 /DNA_ORIENTATION=-
MGLFTCCASKPSTRSTEFDAAVHERKKRVTNDAKEIGSTTLNRSISKHELTDTVSHPNLDDASILNGGVVSVAVMDCTSSALTDLQAVQLLSRETANWRAADPTDQVHLENLASEDLKPLAMIGEGGYGTVKLCSISQSIIKRSSSMSIDTNFVPPKKSKHRRAVSQPPQDFINGGIRSTTQPGTSRRNGSIHSSQSRPELSRSSLGSHTGVNGFPSPDNTSDVHPAARNEISYGSNETAPFGRISRSSTGTVATRRAKCASTGQLKSKGQVQSQGHGQS